MVPPSRADSQPGNGSHRPVSCSSGFTAWGANLQAENGPHRRLLTHSRHRRASPQPPLFLTPVTFWTQNEREHACNPLSTPRVSAKQPSSKFRAVAKRANPFSEQHRIQALVVNSFRFALVFSLCKRILQIFLGCCGVDLSRAQDSRLLENGEMFANSFCKWCALVLTVPEILRIFLDCLHLCTSAEMQFACFRDRGILLAVASGLRSLSNLANSLLCHRQSCRAPEP